MLWKDEDLDLKSRKPQSFVRSVLIGTCVVLLLVALWTQVKPAKRPIWREMVSTEQEEHASPSRCVKTLTERAKEHDGSESASAMMQDFPGTKESVIATVNADGSISKLDWNEENLKRMSARERVNENHKFIEMGSHRILVYPDNTIVDLDTKKCVIVGLYEHAPNGDVHPLVRDAMEGRLSVARDKGGGCNQDHWGRCYKDGQYCRSVMRSMGRGQWTGPNCPSGWTKDTSMVNTFGGTQPQYTCGCGTACHDPLKCDDLGNRGKCDLRRNQCDLVAGLGGSVTDSSTVIGNIQAAVSVGAALAALTPGGNAIGIIASFAGFAGNLGMTGEQAYNALLAKLNQLATDVEACINIKITEEILRQIQVQLTTMGNNLKPSRLEGSTVAHRIVHTWNSNTPLCENVGSHFTTLRNNHYAYEILPLGLKAAELCLANYAGLVADRNAQNQKVSILVIRKYRTMLNQISSSTAAVITKFHNQYKGVNQCGFFTSDRNLLNNKINYLNGVLAQLNKLKAAFDRCPTANVAQGKPTHQSSTGWDAPSSRAVDGNSNGRSCTHTHHEHRAFWYVDLGGTYEVCSVQITNRADCCWDRLSNFDIFVADHTPNRNYPVQGSAADTCRHWGGSFGGTRTFTCVTPVTGRYVNIRLRGSNYLTLCEVKVFGRLLS